MLLVDMCFDRLKGEHRDRRISASNGELIAVGQPQGIPGVGKQCRVRDAVLAPEKAASRRRRSFRERGRWNLLWELQSPHLLKCTSLTPPEPPFSRPRQLLFPRCRRDPFS